MQEYKKYKMYKCKCLIVRCSQGMSELGCSDKSIQHHLDCLAGGEVLLLKERSMCQACFTVVYRSPLFC